MEIPNYIDEPQLVLAWTVDEAIPMVAILGLGFFTGNLTLAILASWGFLRFYRRHRENHARGYLQHVTYRYGLAGPAKSRTFYNAFIREFHG